MAPSGPAGCGSPSPEKQVSNIAQIAGLTLVLSLGVSPARAEIIAHVDENGRRIFINTEDEELRRAVLRGGPAAGRRLLERRKQSMPGIEQHIETVAQRHQVDPRLVKAMIEVESEWNPNAQSRAGALGLMQLVPETGARYGLKDPYDPRDNISAGVRYLRFLLDRFENDLELALAAYNAGENAVTNYKGVPPYAETRRYLQKITTVYGRLGSHVRGTGNIYRTVENGRAIFVNE